MTPVLQRLSAVSVTVSLPCSIRWCQVLYHWRCLLLCVTTAPRLCLFTHSESHTRLPTIFCTCCCDEIKGVQDLKIYSHADFLILSLRGFSHSSTAWC